MRFIAVLTFILVAACATQDPAALRQQITTYDMLVNRPGTTDREALFRMMPDGSGTVDFIDSASGAQDVTWTLRGTTFCIDADQGLMADFDCATLSLIGNQVTLAHTESSGVATGVLTVR